MSQKEMHFDVEITGTGFFGHDGGGASRGKPNTRAEVEDTALLIDLGAGFIPVYSAVLDEIERSSRLQTIGIANGLRMEVFAITAQRRLQHPGVAAMTAKPE
jgi:LysR family transcriptional activator of nhaA